MKTIIFLLCLLCGEAAYAQQNRWTVDVSGGLALPVGKFAGKNIYDSTSAFAKAGPVINVSGSYRVAGHFGVTALLGVQRNATDNNAESTKLDAVDPGYVFSVNDQAWKLGRLMGGVYGHWFLDHCQRLGVRVQVLVGVMKVDFPTQTVTEWVKGDPNAGSDESIVDWYKTNPQFAYQAGVGIDYALNRRLFLKIDADYEGARQRVLYPAVVLASRATPGAPPEGFSEGSVPPPQTVPINNTVPYTQPLTTINYCLGIGVRF